MKGRGQVNSAGFSRSMLTSGGRAWRWRARGHKLRRFRSLGPCGCYDGASVEDVAQPLATNSQVAGAQKLRFVETLALCVRDL